MRTIILLSLLLSIYRTAIQAQTVALWDFENVSSVPSGPIAPSFLAENTTQAFADLSGANSSGSPAVCSGSGTWATNFWPTSNGLNPGYYYSFEVHAEPGYVVNIRFFSFGYSLSSSYSPQEFAIGYSVDGGPDYIAYNASAKLSSNCGSIGIYTGATSQSGGFVRFKLFFFAQPSDGLAATVRIDNVSLNGGVRFLPVVFSQFTGTGYDEGIALQWTTAQETRNERFEVERSADGQRFRQIGVVAARSEKSYPTHYRFEDNYPFPGENFYRLRQVDTDGGSAYSETIVVQSLNTYTSGIRVFPNPFQKELTIQLPRHLSAEAQLRCVSATGQLVSKFSIQESQRILEIDLGPLPPGAYFLLLTDREVSWQHKLIKTG